MFSNPEKAPKKIGKSQSLLIKSSDTLGITLDMQIHFAVILNFLKRPLKSHQFELQPLALVLISLSTDTFANIFYFSGCH